MGALHEGHASLVRQSVAENDYTIVSIFVNPTQFGPNEDLDQYPRDMAGDTELLRSLGVDMIFAPDSDAVYPKPPSQIMFGIRDLDKRLCGSSRPGHMNGVVQVVSILFHIVQPSHAYFGLKDYQQCLIIRQMVSELHFPVEVVPCEIVREADGLAMSSRNLYLSPEQRKQAVFLNQTLSYIYSQREQWSEVAQIQAWVQDQLADFPLVELDYFEVLDGDTLLPIQQLTDAGTPVAFIAAYLGKTRIIDNRILI